MDKEKMLDYLYDVRDDRIPIEYAVKDLENILKTQEHVIAQENLTLKCELYDAELKIEELEATVKELDDEWSIDLLQAEIGCLEKASGELRTHYQKRLNDEEKVFADIMGIVLKREADKINEVELLKADVRRLEKYIRDHDFILRESLGGNTDIDYENSSNKAFIDGLAFFKTYIVPLEERMNDKPLSCEEQMKQTDALRDAAMDRMNEYKAKSDPWETLVKQTMNDCSKSYVERCKFIGSLLEDAKEPISNLIGLSNKHDLFLSGAAETNINHPSFPFSVTFCTQGSNPQCMMLGAKDLQTFEELKEFYNHFKEVCG